VLRGPDAFNVPIRVAEFAWHVSASLENPNMLDLFRSQAEYQAKKYIVHEYMIQTFWLFLNKGIPGVACVLNT